MRLIPDTTGRFPTRPFYSEEELDSVALVALGQIERPSERYPVNTTELCAIAARKNCSVEVEADLPEGVDAKIQFFINGAALISVTSAKSSLNRLRMSIAHEVGHLILHKEIISESQMQDGVFEISVGESAPSEAYDWLEWQASFFGASLLMPRNALVAWLRENRNCTILPYRVKENEWESLIGAIATDFSVSKEATRIRTGKLRILIADDGQRGLFT